MSKKRQRLSIQENALNVEKKAKQNALSLLETCIGRYNIDARSKNSFMTDVSKTLGMDGPYICKPIPLNMANANQTLEPVGSKLSPRNHQKSSQFSSLSSPTLADDSNNNRTRRDEHNEVCEICDAGGDLLCCDTCNLVFHLFCLKPRMMAIPKGQWSCVYCIIEGLAVGDVDEATTNRDKMESVNRRMSNRLSSSSSSSSSTGEIHPVVKSPNIGSAAGSSHFQSGLTITRSGKQYVLTNTENLEIAKFGSMEGVCAQIKKFQKSRVYPTQRLAEGSKADSDSLWCTHCIDDNSISMCIYCGCQVCFGKHNVNCLLLCDGCDKEFHTYCLQPKLDSIPSDNWYCMDCVKHGVTSSTRQQSGMRAKGNAAAVKAGNKAAVAATHGGGSVSSGDSEEDEERDDSVAAVDPPSQPVTTRSRANTPSTTPRNGGAAAAVTTSTVDEKSAANVASKQTNGVAVPPLVIGTSAALQLQEGRTSPRISSRLSKASTSKSQLPSPSHETATEPIMPSASIAVTHAASQATVTATPAAAGVSVRPTEQHSSSSQPVSATSLAAAASATQATGSTAVVSVANKKQPTAVTTASSEAASVAHTAPPLVPNLPLVPEKRGRGRPAGKTKLKIQSQTAASGFGHGKLLGAYRPAGAPPKPVPLVVSVESALALIRNKQLTDDTTSLSATTTGVTAANATTSLTFTNPEKNVLEQLRRWSSLEDLKEVLLFLEEKRQELKSQFEKRHTVVTSSNSNSNGGSSSDNKHCFDDAEGEDMPCSTTDTGADDTAGDNSGTVEASMEVVL